MSRYPKYDPLPHQKKYLEAVLSGKDFYFHWPMQSGKTTARAWYERIRLLRVLKARVDNGSKKSD